MLCNFHFANILKLCFLAPIAQVYDQFICVLSNGRACTWVCWNRWNFCPSQNLLAGLAHIILRAYFLHVWTRATPVDSSSLQSRADMLKWCVSILADYHDSLWAHKQQISCELLTTREHPCCGERWYRRNQNVKTFCCWMISVIVRIR